MRITALFSGLAFALMTSASAMAADIVAPDLCAVSGFNGKLSAEGGVWDFDNYDSDGQFQGVGSISLPLGCALGFQADVGAATFGDADAFGVGGHLFTRDPSSYLLGVHGTYESWDFDGGNDLNVYHIGAEGELYLGNISLEAWAGVVDTDETKAKGFAKLTAAYYATDDLRLSVGLRQDGGFSAGVLGAEWQLGSAPLSLTTEAQLGEDDFMSLTAGVKFYFGGPQKSLIDRHRQDDPADGLFDFLGGAASAASSGDGTPILDGCTTDGVCDGCTADGICDGTLD